MKDVQLVQAKKYIILYKKDELLDYKFSMELEQEEVAQKNFRKVKNSGTGLLVIVESMRKEKMPIELKTLNSIDYGFSYFFGFSLVVNLGKPSLMWDFFQNINRT